jgi:hypothetical protein
VGILAGTLTLVQNWWAGTGRLARRTPRMAPRKTSNFANFAPRAPLLRIKHSSTLKRGYCRALRKNGAISVHGLRGSLSSQIQKLVEQLLDGRNYAGTTAISGRSGDQIDQILADITIRKLLSTSDDCANTLCARAADNRQS